MYNIFFEMIFEMRYHHTENGWKNSESLNIDIVFTYRYIL